MLPDSQAAAATSDIPWLVQPSGVQDGTDATNVQSVLATYGVAWLGPGIYYANSTVTCHEGQYVCGAGRNRTFWNLTTSNTAAFVWSPQAASSYSVHGGGGITGVTITGPSASVCPSDESIGVQMGDIVQLRCDVEVINCQYGLLLSNQYFWTEQGAFTTFTHGCTNPVVLQCAPSGGASRTGSFDRCDITVYHDDTISGSFGPGGVQVVAGAQLLGGALRQYGNFKGSGQSSVYALYVSGSLPAGASGSGSSYIDSVELVHVMEWDGSGIAPGTIGIGAGCKIIGAFGALRYSISIPFGSSSVSADKWSFSGSIIGDTTLQSSLWGSITSGLPAGWKGAFKYAITSHASGMATLAVEITLAASTSITQGETLCQLPPGFSYPKDMKRVLISYQAYGGTYSTAFLEINSSGVVTWTGPPVKTPSGGNSYLYGQADYPVLA
jgi:hypothetical protein